MSQYITEIAKDGELNSALANFSSVCSTNAAALGLGPPDIAEISGASSVFNTTLNAWTAAKATAESAKTTKNTQKTTSKAIVSKWAKVFRAKTTVTDTLLAQLMLPPHKTPGNSTPPTIPSDVIASSDGLGNVRLVWKRNGNKANTVFVIEYRSSSTGPWTFLGTSTSTKFATEWQPGSYVGFRVTAQRAGMTSAPSNPVVLWETGGLSVTQLKVA